MLDAVLENKGENAYNASLLLSFSSNLLFSSLVLQVRPPPPQKPPPGKNLGVLSPLGDHPLPPKPPPGGRGDPLHPVWELGIPLCPPPKPPRLDGEGPLSLTVPLVPPPGCHILSLTPPWCCVPPPQDTNPVKLECTALGGHRRLCSVGYPVFRSMAKVGGRDTPTPPGPPFWTPPGPPQDPHSPLAPQVSFTLEFEFSCSVLLGRAEVSLEASR